MNLEFTFNGVPDNHLGPLEVALERHGDGLEWLRLAVEYTLDARRGGAQEPTHELNVDDLSRQQLVALIAVLQNLRDTMARDRRPALAATFADLLGQAVCERLRRDEQAAYLERAAVLDDFGPPDTEWTASVAD